MAEKPSKLRAEWFWTDRWFGSSAIELAIEPRGLYREMLTRAWPRGARLPNDHEAIRRLIGCTPAEWKRCWPKVQPYWRVDGEALVNDTQLEIYAEAVKLFEGSSERGKKGAQARWHKPEQSPSNATGNAQASAGHKPEQWHQSLSPSPTPTTHKPVLSGPTARGRSDGLMAGSRPMDHGDCLAHGPVCFRPFIAKKYLPRFGGDQARMVAWAKAVCDRELDRVERGGQVAEGDDFAYWSARYSEDHKHTHNPRTAGNIGAAERFAAKGDR